ncbi:MAG: hypothetical protein LBV13_00825 [Methanomassiliicoccaceae archaeon]|jgi:hypothetical protein|nr:hypothetical protein [Methanomassiliicoccaceae archaeon]
MKMNSRGEGGLTESVLAVMIVIISLTAFLSFLAFSMSEDQERGKEVPLDFLDDVQIINGAIEADIEEKMEELIRIYGFIGMCVILSTSGIYDSEVKITTGSTDSDTIISAGGAIAVRSDDGRSVPVNYSVAVWI